VRTLIDESLSTSRTRAQSRDTLARRRHSALKVRKNRNGATSLERGGRDYRFGAVLARRCGQPIASVLNRVGKRQARQRLDTVTRVQPAQSQCDCDLSEGERRERARSRSTRPLRLSVSPSTCAVDQGCSLARVSSVRRP